MRRHGFGRVIISGMLAFILAAQPGYSAFAYEAPMAEDSIGGFEEDSETAGSAENSEEILLSEEGGEIQDEALDTSAQNGLIISRCPGEAVYTGEKIVFSSDDLRVSYNGELLEQGRDYKVKYKNNLTAWELPSGKGWDDIGAADLNKAPMLTVTAAGSFEGSLTRHFEIHPMPVKDTEITSDMSITAFENDSVIAPVPALRLTLASGKTYSLKNKSDYSVSYHSITLDDTGENIVSLDLENTVSDLKKQGRYLINIHGTGNFGGDLLTAEEAKKQTKASELKAYPILTVYPASDKGKVISLDKTKLTRSIPAQKFERDSKSGAPMDLTAKVSEYFSKGTVKVRSGKTELVYGTDYEIAELSEGGEPSDGRNSAPGSGAYITLIPKNAGSNILSGSKKVSFNITGYKMNSVKISNLASSVTRTETPLTVYSQDESGKYSIDKAATLKKLAKNQASPVTLTAKGGIVLSEDSYDLSISGDTRSIGTVTLKFKGIRSMGTTGTLTKKVKVSRIPLKADKMSVSFSPGVSENSVPYSKSGAKPEVKVRYNASGSGDEGTLLTEGADYTVVYGKNKKVGSKGTVTIKGCGNFSGSLKTKLSFTVAKASLGDVKVNAGDKVLKTKTAKEGYYCSVPALYDGGKQLKLHKDYEYADGAGPVYYYDGPVLIDGHSFKKSDYFDERYVCSGCPVRVKFAVVPAKNSCYSILDGKASVELEAVYHIAKYDIHKAKAEISPVAYAGAGVQVIPEKEDIKSIKLGSTKLTNDDYTIESAANNTKVGKAVLTVRGTGDYCGTAKLPYRIIKGTTKKQAAEDISNKAEGFEVEIKAPDPEEPAVSGNNIETTGNISANGISIEIDKSALVSDSRLTVTPLSSEQMRAMGAMAEGEADRIISPVDIKCDTYDGTIIGGEAVTLTLPMKDKAHPSRYVFCYYDEQTGQIRYLYPDRYDTVRGEMSIALPHYSSWWGKELTKQEQIEAFLDNYATKVVMDSGKYKKASNDLEPYLKIKAEALGLTKEAAADLVQAAMNYLGGSVEGEEDFGSIEIGTNYTSGVIRAIYDNDSEALVDNYDDLVNMTFAKMWDKLKFADKIDKGIIVGNANNIARMAGYFASGTDEGYEEGMKVLGDILQGTVPGVELATKGARFLGSCANTAFVYWKANEVEELYQIYKNGLDSRWFGNEVIAGDKESFLMYLNYSSGFTKAKGINRFYNMDKMPEIFLQMKNTDKTWTKYKRYEDLPPEERDRLQKYAEDGLIEYFETRRAQEGDADKVKASERPIVEAMLIDGYGALYDGKYHKFFYESSVEDYNIQNRLERLVMARNSLKSYVDLAELENYTRRGELNWGDLLNEWVADMDACGYDRDEALKSFKAYLKEQNLLNKNFITPKKPGPGPGPDPDPDPDPDPTPEPKTGREWRVWDSDDGVYHWEGWYDWDLGGGYDARPVLEHTKYKNGVLISQEYYGEDYDPKAPCSRMLWWKDYRDDGKIWCEVQLENKGDKYLKKIKRYYGKDDDPEYSRRLSPQLEKEYHQELLPKEFVNNEGTEVFTWEEGDIVLDYEYDTKGICVRKFEADKFDYRYTDSKSAQPGTLYSRWDKTGDKSSRYESYFMTDPEGWPEEASIIGRYSSERTVINGECVLDVEWHYRKIVDEYEDGYYTPNKETAEWEYVEPCIDYTYLLEAEVPDGYDSVDDIVIYQYRVWLNK